jgi:hypothetical protein
MVEHWDKEEDESYSIVINNTIGINFIPIGRTPIIFQGCIGEALPTNNSTEAKLRQLLQWNFARIEDDSDVLSVY